MPGVFLLGPDQWDDAVEVAPPAWATSLLGPGAHPFTPHNLRKALAIHLERESFGEWHGLVMDPEGQKPGEDDADYFERIEAENNPVAYLFIIPEKAKIIGTVFEEGMLRRDFKYGIKPRILLFLEEGTALAFPSGAFEFVSKGKRARYLRSLARKAEHVEFWRTFDELRDTLLRRVVIGLA